MSSEYTQLISQLRENQRSNNKNAAKITTSLQHAAGTYSEYASTITRELQETRASNFAAVNQISSYIQNSNNSLMSTMMNATYGIQGVIQDSSRAVIVSQAMLAQKLGQELNTLSNTINTNLSFLHSEINSLENTIAEKADAFIKLQNALYDLQKNPRRTQSQEAYVRAEDNYKNKFYKEALEECNLAIENFKTDFLSWYLLGHIYLFGAGEFDNVIDVDKAIEAFENAAKYISPYINDNDEAKNLSSEMYYFLGFARLSKSNDLLVENKLEESKKLLDAAELASRKSFELSNKTRLVAGYELAKELHFLERDDESLKLLEEIIRANSYFAIKAGSDPSFGSMPIEGLIKKLMDELVSKIKPELDEYARQIELLSNIGAWGINNDPNLTKFKSLLPNQDIYETYFSIREFSESEKYEEIQNIWKKLEALCLGNDSYESGLLNIYNRAKEANNTGNIEEALNRLRVLINDNWYFYVKARCDLDFESIWPKIDELLNSLREDILLPMMEKSEEANQQIRMLSEMEAYKVKYSNQLSDVKTVLLEMKNKEELDFFSILEFKEKSWDDICQTIDNLVLYCINERTSDSFEQQYKSIQELYAAGDTEQALNELKACIRIYWYSAVRALSDKKFEAVREKINNIIEELKDELTVKIKNYCSELRTEAQKEFTRLKQEADEIIPKVEEGFKEVDAVHQEWASKTYSTPELGRFQEKKKNFPINISESQAFLNIESIAKEAEVNSVKDYFTVRETWEKLESFSVSEKVRRSFSGITQDINTIKEISSDIPAILNSERKQLEDKKNWDEEKKQKEREKRLSIAGKWIKRLFFVSIAVAAIIIVFRNV